jgi:hypothetical protein
MKDLIIGMRVTAIRPLTQKELTKQCWDHGDRCMALEFEDGTLVYASQDEEGNGPGSLFGNDPKGAGFQY